MASSARHRPQSRFHGSPGRGECAGRGRRTARKRPFYWVRQNIRRIGLGREKSRDIGRSHDSTGRRDEANVQGEDVALLEKGLFIGCDRISVGLGLDERSLATSAAVTIPRVAGTRRMCRERTSHCSKKAFLLGATEYPSDWAWTREASRDRPQSRFHGSPGRGECAGRGRRTARKRPFYWVRQNIRRIGLGREKPREIGRSHDSTGRRDEANVQGEDVALLEKGLFIGCDRISVGLGLDERSLATSAAVTIPRVAGTRRMCRERTSHCSKKAFLLGATEYPSDWAWTREASRHRPQSRFHGSPGRGECAGRGRRTARKRPFYWVRQNIRRIGLGREKPR